MESALPNSSMEPGPLSHQGQALFQFPGIQSKLEQEIQDIPGLQARISVPLRNSRPSRTTCFPAPWPGMAPLFLKQILFKKSRCQPGFQSTFASISSQTNCGKSKPRESQSLIPKNTMRSSTIPFPRPQVVFSVDSNSCLFPKNPEPCFKVRISSLKNSIKIFLPFFFFEICI